jgi:DNA-binding transcriptional LysR family regulator
MRNLNLDQLQALVQVVELGNFSAAARKLNLSQPAVSIQIRELELRLGVSLVRRVGKHAFATAAGRELIVHARDIFDTTDRALAAVRRHEEGSGRYVHIGAGQAALSYLLLPILRRLRVEHPAIQLAVTTGKTHDITERMLRNTIDLGFTGLPVDQTRFDVTPVREMRMVAILPPYDKEAPRVIRPADLAKRPLVVMQQRSNHAQLATDWLRAAGLDAHPAMEIDNLAAIKNVVATGLGAAIVPEESVTGAATVSDLLVRQLDPPLALQLGLIRLPRASDDPALRLVEREILTLKDARSATLAA